MYYCNECNKVIEHDELIPKKICFETEFGVGSLFRDRHYHTVYHCPHCGSNDVEEAEKCQVCGEWFGLEQLNCDFYCEECAEDEANEMKFDCFVNKYSSEIMEGLSRQHPEYIKNDETMICDIPDDIVESFIYENMATKYENFNDWEEQYE